MSSAAIFYYSIFAVLIIGIRVGLYKLFEKAGESGWKAFIPIYSDVVWLKIIGKPLWWVVLTLIPVARTLVKISMNIDLVKSFGQYTFGAHVLAVILPFYYFPKLGFDPAKQYLGPPDTHKKVPPKSGAREWGDAFLYAGVAALIIRTFFIEAFMIPTSSMERTLMAGDFLFVSKFHYGPRMPMVPLAVPFVHNKIKIGDVSIPSYIGSIQLPYFRLPGLTKVKRNDIVVFNYPAHDIHDLGDGAGKVKPISMKENYIKRCVGMPGDTLQIINQQVYIDGEKAWNPPNMQLEYDIRTEGGGFTYSKFLNDLGFRNPNGENINYRQIGPNRYIFLMPEEVAQEIRKVRFINSLDTVSQAPGAFDLSGKVYPREGNRNGELYAHNIDNFGPIVIPQKGMTVTLNSKNTSLYARVIRDYENHELRIDASNNQVYVDGSPADTYTFEMDYYMMMGDNRHNSEDSRYWGFVPENHIVGKPLFIFFSYEKDFGIRLGRIGTKHIQ